MGGKRRELRRDLIPVDVPVEEDELVGLEYLHGESTPGEWRATMTGAIIQTDHITRDVWHIPMVLVDSDFICRAHAMTPRLIRTIRDLRARVSQLEDDVAEAKRGRCTCDYPDPQCCEWA